MTRSALCASAVLASIAVAADAHHGWSSYDAEKVISLRGTFTSVNWANPHGTAMMIWEGRNWDVVLAPIGRMEARGLTRDMIAPGQQIRIVGYPRKDGTREIRLERITVGDQTIELR